MRLFVTGATGFAGSHLVDHLVRDGHEMIALIHPATSHQQLPESPLLQTVEGDLLDQDSLAAAISEAQPDVVFHLAGQAYPTRSWQDPAFTFAVNTGGTANLLQAAIQYGRPRTIVVTSAEIFGRVSSDELPLTEESLPQPRHPYGISKWAAGKLTQLYWQHYQLPVIEARPFNHIGPNQARGFVVADFASQLAKITLGQQEPRMLVGNLDAQRDFTDVRDVTAAYVALAERGHPGEAYLICSNRPVSIRAVLDILVELSGLDVEIVHDPERMRPSDTPCLFGSYAKLQEHTGWNPNIGLRQSLADSLHDWLDRLQ